MGTLIAVMFAAAIAGSLILGTENEMSAAFSQSALDTAELAVTLAASMAFWSGMMRLAKKCGLVYTVCRAVRPLLRCLMPDISPGGEAQGLVSMNAAANLLGLGNAAAPIGIAAMRALCREGASRRTLAAFLLLNTASVQLIPMTLITLRTKAGSASPADIVLPVICCSALALAAGLISVFLLYGGEGCSCHCLQRPRSVR